MNHPTPEEWMSCLYGEADPRARASAEAHLEVCPECRARVTQWRAAMASLDEDRGTLVVTRARGGVREGQAWARPLLAASIILVAGFVGGRLSGPSRSEVRAELAESRAQLEADIRSRYEKDLREVAVATVTATSAENRKWLEAVTTQWAADRLEDRALVEAALLRLDAKLEVDSVAVRAGLLGLARYTGSGFEQTQSQFNRLSQVNAPQSNPSDINPPINPSLQ